MSDVFISYSRQDIEFVRKLFTALEATGRDAWVDWEGIPYSVDWWQEICRGIDAAETFVFVISPDSMASMICNQEVPYARDNNKRFIPIIFRDVDEKQMVGEWYGQDWEQTARDNWEMIKHINWLFFRDFDTAFQSLVKTVEEDPEHVRYHTRLLVRAREWENSSERDSGLLLRGDDLRQAEAWLEFNKSKSPGPTALHQEYVLASLQQRQLEEERERRQRQRLRAAVVALAVFLVIAIGASIFAFDQQDEAQSQANRAETQAVIAQQQAGTATVAQGDAEFQAETAVAAQATSERQREEALSVLWANAAQDVFNEDNDEALNLAIAANRIDNPPLVARDTLAQVRYAPSRVRRLPQYHSDSVNSVALSADGRTLVSGADDNTLIVWDLETGQALRTLTGHTDAVRSVAISPDGYAAISASWDNTLIVWDLETGQALHTLTGHTNWVLSVAISPDGYTAMSTSWDRTMMVWDLETGQALRTMTGHPGIETSVAISPDGRTAISGASDTNMIMWDLETGQDLRTMTGHTDTVTSVAISSDGRTVIPGSEDSSVIVWDVETGQALRTMTGHTDSVTGVAISSDGRTAISASWDRTLIVWDVETGQVLRTLTGHQGRVNSVAISADGRIAVSGGDDTIVIVWDLQTGQALHSLTVHTDTVRSVAISSDGRIAVSGGDDTIVIAWDVEEGQALRTLTGHIAAVSSVAISPDGYTALSGSSDESLIVWKLDTVDEQADWLYRYRNVHELTCLERIVHNFEPRCDENGTFPTRTPYMTWTPSPAPTGTATANLTLTTATLTSTITPTIPTRTSTPTFTPSLTPTITLTPSPTATPEHKGTVEIGQVVGEFPLGGSDVWRYDGTAGEIITILAEADKPAGGVVSNERVEKGLLDTYLILKDSLGKILAEADDQDSIEDNIPEHTNSKLIFELTSDGIVHIEVRSWNNGTGGKYTLTIESSLHSDPEAIPLTASVTHDPITGPTQEEE